MCVMGDLLENQGRVGEAGEGFSGPIYKLGEEFGHMSQRPRMLKFLQDISSFPSHTSLYAGLHSHQQFMFLLPHFSTIPDYLFCLMVHSGSSPLPQKPEGGRMGHKSICTHHFHSHPDGQKLVLCHLPADVGRQAVSEQSCDHLLVRDSFPMRSGKQYQEAVAD